MKPFTFDYYDYVADLEYFKYPFPGLENLWMSYGESSQDLFVITLLKGKRDGYYIELGSRHPVKKNNTFMLERDFDWKGFSIDRDPSYYDLFNKVRLNKTILAEALEFDFTPYVDMSVDYLSADLEAPTTYIITRRILDKGIRPSIITLEHDCYVHGENAFMNRDYICTVLGTFGYQRIVKGGLTVLDHEDWYVLPEKVDMELAEKLKGEISGSMRGAQYHFFRDKIDTH